MFFCPMTTILVMLIKQIKCKKIYLKGNVTLQLLKKIEKLQCDAASKMCPLHVHMHTYTHTQSAGCVMLKSNAECSL